VTTPTVISIGTFDGVHTGHAALIRCARHFAGSERGAGGPGRVVAMAFDPHPASVLRPGHAPGRLTTFEERSRLLRGAGADDVVRLEPSPELLSLTPEQFIDRVVRDHHPIAFVEGPDFHFGKGRAGNVRALDEIARKRGATVEIVPPVEATLVDQTVVTASSTMTRWLIERGRVADAARILGRPYDLTGVVVKGDQRGRQIGFPTANLDTPLLLPADAVYAGVASLPDGRTYPAAIHVGPRATFNDVRRTVEAYIMDWDGPVAEGSPEYGWPLRLSLISWLRDQARFESVSALVEQIERDVRRAREACDLHEERALQAVTP